MRGHDRGVTPGRSAPRAPVPVVLGVAVVFAGVAYPVTGAALEFTTPALIATVRALAGGLLMLPVLRLVGARLPSTWAGWRWALAIGAGNVTLTLVGISEGTRLAGAAVASVLLNSAPFFAAVFARVLLGERLTRLRVAGLVTGFAGFAGIIVIVATEPSGSGGSHVLEGVVVCLMGALGWAAAGLGMRYLSVRDAHFDVWGATTAQFFCGGVLLIPYLIATGGANATDWSSTKLWASLIFLVIGAQVITYVGFYVALAQWTSARVFAWTFLAPAVAVVIEALQGNLPSTLTTLGLIIVIAGVATVTTPRAEAAGA
jgi:drug/metabolite transporter (DMT)-like permease